MKKEWTNDELELFTWNMEVKKFFVNFTRMINEE